MTRTGVLRERYSSEIEARPSRFSNPARYAAWTARADAWAATPDHVDSMGEVVVFRYATLAGERVRVLHVLGDVATIRTRAGVQFSGPFDTLSDIRPGKPDSEFPATMSAWGESRRYLMTSATIAANEALEAGWFQS
jgi:hypothetical protein